MNNLIQVFGITQPTAFVNMMSDCTGNQVIFIRIRTLNQKFRHTVSNRSFLDMLTQRPPTIIIHLFKITLRAFKQRNVVFHPLRSFCVRNRLNDILIFHSIKIIRIMAEILILQESGRCILVCGRRFYISYTIFGHRLLFTGTGQIVCLVGRSIHCRECTWHACTESYSFDTCHRSIEHPQPYPLAIYIYLNITVSR